MQNKFFLFQLGRVPVFANPSALLLVFFCLTAYRYLPFPQMLAMGFIYALGIFISIVAHEFGHVLMAGAFGIGTQSIELHGLGGFTHLARSIRSRFQSICISLAGPGVNFLLYLLAIAIIDGMGRWNMLQYQSGRSAVLPSTLFQAVGDFGLANLIMLIFNLLPAFPLDGGRALREMIGAVTRNGVATRIIAVLGMIIAAATLALVPRFGIGIVFIGLYLLFENYQALQNAR